MTINCVWSKQQLQKSVWQHYHGIASLNFSQLATLNIDLLKQRLQFYIKMTEEGAEDAYYNNPAVLLDAIASLQDTDIGYGQLAIRWMVFKIFHVTDNYLYDGWFLKSAMSQTHTYTMDGF